MNLTNELDEAFYNLRLKVDRRVNYLADQFLFRLWHPKEYQEMIRIRAMDFAIRFGGFEIVIPPNYIFIENITA